MRIDDFTAYAGLSRSYTYALAKKGKLRFAKVGRRTLVDVSSYEELIAESSEEKPTRPAPRHLRRASHGAPEEAAE
jgi:excisionase family DNA binding protein